MMVYLVLRAEVEKLKQLNCASAGDDVISQSHREVAWLRHQLMAKETEMNDMNRSAVSQLPVVASFLLLLRNLVSAGVKMLLNWHQKGTVSIKKLMSAFCKAIFRDKFLEHDCVVVTMQ